MPVESEHVKSFLTRLLSFFKFAKGKGFDSDYLFLLCARFSLFVCLFIKLGCRSMNKYMYITVQLTCQFSHQLLT